MAGACCHRTRHGWLNDIQLSLGRWKSCLRGSDGQVGFDSREPQFLNIEVQSRMPLHSDSEQISVPAGLAPGNPTERQSSPV